MYYWDQFHPILAAIVILLIGWIIALLVAAGVKTSAKVNTNAKLSSATGRTPNIEGLISKVVFWFILILAVVAALNVLNISGVSGPFSNMVNQVLVYIPNIIAAVVVGFIGWIVARLVRAGVTNVLSRTQLDDKLSSEVGVGELARILAKFFTGLYCYFSFRLFFQS